MSDRLQKAEAHARAARDGYTKAVDRARELWREIQGAMRETLESRLELDVAEQEYQNAAASEGETFVIVTGVTNVNELEALRKNIEWARRFVQS